MAAAVELSDSPLFHDLDRASLKAIRVYLAKHAGSVVAARAALNPPYSVPLRFEAEDFESHAAEWPSFRVLAHALSVLTRDLYSRGDLPEAASAGVDILRLANAIRCGGLKIDSQVGNCIASIGIRELRRLRPSLSAQQSTELSARLEELLDAREPFARVLERDRDWSRRTGFDQHDPRDDFTTAARDASAESQADPGAFRLVTDALLQIQAEPEELDALISQQDDEAKFAFAGFIVELVTPNSATP